MTTVRIFFLVSYKFNVPLDKLVLTEVAPNTTNDYIDDVIMVMII
jgi:hypothetical protein